MYIIQHRVNDHKQGKLADYAEMDVWLDPDGEFRVKHDVRGDSGPPPILLSEYLAAATFNGYFVNIKQAMGLYELNRLTKLHFNNKKLLGYFDVPQPLAYYAECGGHKIFHRRSEFELTERARYNWIDPLRGRDVSDFINVIGIARGGESYMICCPSLHLVEFSKIEPVWNFVKEIHKETGRICGIVTKHPERAMEFFN